MLEYQTRDLITDCCPLRVEIEAKEAKKREAALGPKAKGKGKK